jgi:hypothetical protein
MTYFPSVEHFLLTWVASKDNKDRRNDECDSDPILLNIGAELNGIKTIHNNDRSAATEREMQKLDSTLFYW